MNNVNLIQSSGERSLTRSNASANKYCVVIKAIAGKKGGYRWVTLLINRKSDMVSIPEGNVHKRGDLAAALILADNLRAGTARPLHIALDGYASELSTIDRDVIEQVTGESLVQRHAPVDAELERIKYYARPDSAWGEGNEMVGDVYDLSSAHYA